MVNPRDLADNAEEEEGEEGEEGEEEEEEEEGGEEEKEEEEEEEEQQQQQQQEEDKVHCRLPTSSAMPSSHTASYLLPLGKKSVPFPWNMPSFMLPS